jgi:hypothetical protein
MMWMGSKSLLLLTVPLMFLSPNLDQYFVSLWY